MLEQKISPKSLLLDIQSKLQGIYDTNEAHSIATLILEYMYEISSIDIIKNTPLISFDKKKYNSIISKLQKEEPIQYILGKANFYGYDFEVNQHTLIPRQETELLVDLIINDNADASIHILDIGTGSGCIAITLAKFIKQSNVYGLDISDHTVNTAKKNANKNDATATFIQHDIFNSAWPNGIPKLNVIVSNPPYVTKSEQSMMRKNVLEYEPKIALFVEDHDPLVYYTHITRIAQKQLQPQGKLYFEINERYGEEVKSIMKKHHFEKTEIIKDLNGKDRIVKGVLVSN